MENIGYIEQKKNTHLYFSLGSSKYAINTSNVLEIMKLPALDYPQKLPNNIIGLLKYNGFVINVIDIRFYLNIEVSNYNINHELLIVKTDETIFGIVTDKIIGIVPFDSSKIDTIPFVDNKTIIDSIYKQERDTVFIVNIYSIENLLKATLNIPEVNIQALFPSDADSVSIMQSRAHVIAQKSNLSIMSGELHYKKKLVSFNLNEDLYCIPLEYVKEVLKDTSITKVPGTPEFIAGIMNLRGDYITVLNMKKFLNIPETTQVQSSKNPVIILSNNDMDLAILIDRINELFEFPEDMMNESGEGYYAAGFIYKSSPYTVLNVEKIFEDKKIIITDM